jgi:hypothetical protein
MPDPTQQGMGVDAFWAELKTRYPCEEFIESSDQQGYGIGMLSAIHLASHLAPPDQSRLSP